MSIKADKWIRRMAQEHTDAGTAVSMARVLLTQPHVIAALRTLGADVAVYQKVPANA